MSGAQLRNVWLFIAFVALCSVGLWFALLRDGMPHSSAVAMPLIGFAALVAGVFFIGSRAYAEEHFQRATAEELALTDPLTGIANRAALNRALEQELLFGVVYVDLDGFKAVNDTYGHAAGDGVIVETARRLRDAVRGGDVVARVGGDEFVVLLQPGSSIGEVAGRIDALLNTEFFHGDVVLPVGASVGFVERREGEEPEALMVRADEAMYAAKMAKREPSSVRGEVFDHAGVVGPLDDLETEQ